MRAPRPGLAAGLSILFCSLLAVSTSSQSSPGIKRCLTRDQLNIEPIFSACPPLVDQASVSDNSFVARLDIHGGPSRYTMRWLGQDYFNEDVFTYNEATGLYDGFCATRACSIAPGGWVQMEHWDYFVGTLLAENVGMWTYEELHDGEVFQSRTFDVRELKLSAVSGTDQLGIVGQNTPNPLVLKLESFEGEGIQNEVIGWSIDGPRGAKGAAVYGIGSGSETDANGVDAATIHLGSKPGNYVVRLTNRRVTADSEPIFAFTAIDDIADTNPAQDHPDVEEGVGENRSQQCDSVGNPVTLSVGNKFQREVDLESAGISPLEFIRYHNSMGFVSNSFANYWTHTFDRHVEIPADTLVDPVRVIRPDGRKINFAWNGSSYQAFPGIRSTLEQTAVGWRFTNENLTVENFDADGRLLEITDLAGRSQTATYDTRDRLTRIESNAGGNLDFTYDASDRIATVTDHAGRTWTYEYEILGRLAHVVSPDGTTREYHYEDLRHPYALTGITQENGERYSYYEYDDQGRAVASYHAGDADRVDIRYEANGDRIVLDPLGNATVYQTRIENKRGVLQGISGPICAQGCGQTDSQYAYDADLNVISSTVYGITTRFGDYDAWGQPGYVIRAHGTGEEKRIEYEYDPAFPNRITRITEPSVYPGASKITTRNYDFSGNLLTETITGFDPFGQPVVRSTANRFDGPFGQISSIDGPRTDVSDVTTYEYYPDSPSAGANRARLKAIIDPEGIRLRDEIVYSPTGKIASEVRPNGIEVGYAYYAGSDRIKSVTESGGGLFNRTQWEYFPAGDVRRVIIDDETGEEIITQFAYDAARRLVRVESRVSRGQSFRADQWVSYEFDAAGNITTETLQSRDTPQQELIINRVFDAHDRLDRVTQGDVTEDLDFNQDGTLASRTDGNRNTTSYTYDAFKRLTSTQRVGQVTTFMTYDTHGNQLTVTDPENRTTRYLYDDLGNRVRLDSPDSGVTSYSYNEAGQVITRTDAGGQTSLFTYDAAGRLTGVDREGTDYDVSYTYDSCINGIGRLCTAIAGWGHSVQYEWDAVGEIAAITTNEGHVRFTHGPRQALTSIEYPSGRVILFDIDGGGLTRQIRMRDGELPESVLVDEIGYSPLGRPVTWRYANGRRTTIDLDARHRPVTIEVPGVWLWAAPAYDANDNLLESASAAETYRYEYDALDRLTAADTASLTIRFAYDAVGNLLSRTSGGEAETGSYEMGSNRITAFGDRRYTLDAQGNTVGVRIGESPGVIYGYSSHGRLSEVVDAASSSALASYRFDALGQRVEKVSAAETRKFIYGLHGELLAETEGSGKILHEYVYLNGQPIVDLHEIQEGLQPTSAGEVIIDDEMATVAGGNWQTKSSSSAVNGTYLQNRKRDGRAVYWVVDKPGFLGGPHDVFVKWMQPAGEGISTTYVVNVFGDSTLHRIDVDHGIHEVGDWVLLGNFDFAPAGDSPEQYVALTGFDNSWGYEGTYLEADSVKIVPTFLQVGSSDIKFIHGDHLGTPRFVTDASGEVVWASTHMPFGEAIVNEDPDTDAKTYSLNIRFPGQYYDEETGLHYNYFRTYDPKLGRYLESDPAGLTDSANTYAYALNSPQRYTDPLGLWVKRCARRLGGPSKRPMNPTGHNPLRHDYLVVSGQVYSFQSGGNDWWDMLLSQGRIDDNESINFLCTMICDDEQFDQYVKDAVNEIGAPTYCVGAYPGTPEFKAGARNCQTWVNDVVNLARKNYLESSPGSCPRCFQN